MEAGSTLESHTDQSINAFTRLLEQKSTTPPELNKEITRATITMIKGTNNLKTAILPSFLRFNYYSISLTPSTLFSTGRVNSPSVIASHRFPSISTIPTGRTCCYSRLPTTEGSELFLLFDKLSRFFLSLAPILPYWTLGKKSKKTKPPHRAA